jgi:putative selenate reductase molybdopterin-binding subunit
LHAGVVWFHRKGAYSHMELELRINGVIESLEVAPNESLLALLRREGYYSVKQGCETGDCGACTVLIEGVARPSCTMLAAQVGGCSLTTVEGLSTSGQLHPLQTTFIETGVTSCGFCTSGMLLSAFELLKRNPSPSAEDVRDALSGNLCRCAGYEKPIQAVLRAAAILRGEQVPELTYSVVKPCTESEPQTLPQENLLPSLASVAASAASTSMKMPVIKTEVRGQAIMAGNDQAMPRKQFQVVGRSVSACNALKMVQGKGQFTTDISLRNMLHTRILTSPHAHALIRSIDTSNARAVPGVHAVLAYFDVPRVPYTSVEQPTGNLHEHVQDQYCLDSHLRYVGDRVAVVAAETPEIAEEALQQIEVEYEVLPATLDVRQRLDAQIPPLHPESESLGIYDARRNIATRVHEEVGNVEQGLARADLIAENEYMFSSSQLAPIENHAVLAYFDENDFLVVRTNCQVPQFVRRTLSKLLGLPIKRIRVITPDVGGSFGVKHELCGEDLAALLTIFTRRPVLLEHSRAEEFATRVCSQHILRIKTGVMRDGTIVANQMALLADTGAHGTHPFVHRAHSLGKALALYPAPHMQFVAEVLYSNRPPAAAFVGNGEIQAFFALESHMDDIASRLNIDALALRRQNLAVVGTPYPFRDTTTEKVTVPFIENGGLIECLRLVEESIQWHERPSLRKTQRSGRLRRGIGIAQTFHRYAGSSLHSGAILKMNEDASFDLFVDLHDGGLGATTMITQVAAEVLGVSFDDVVVHTSDIETLPFANTSGAANSLTVIAGAVQRAAEQARRQILAVAGRMLKVMPETLRISNGMVINGSDQPLPMSRIAEHALFIEQRLIMTTASWKLAWEPTTAAVQGVEVEIDIETGYVHVLKVVSAVDVGTVINPMLMENQIHGYIVQGLGLALSEELLYDAQGTLLTSDLRDYPLPNATDNVKIQTFLVETTSSAGGFSTNALAEAVLSGLIPAVANAIFDATGLRLRHAPFTPERVLRAWHARK